MNRRIQSKATEVTLAVQRMILEVSTGVETHNVHFSDFRAFLGPWCSFSLYTLLFYLYTHVYLSFGCSLLCWNYRLV